MAYWLFAQFAMQGESQALKSKESLKPAAKSNHCVIYNAFTICKAIGLKKNRNS